MRVVNNKYFPDGYMRVDIKAVDPEFSTNPIKLKTSISFKNRDQYCHLDLTAAEARDIANYLLELADEVDPFTTPLRSKTDDRE